MGTVTRAWDRPTKEEVLAVMKEVDELELPDGAHWQMIHEKLKLPYGDVFNMIAEDPAFFGVTEQKQ